MSPKQIAWFRAGSALNWLRERAAIGSAGDREGSDPVGAGQGHGGRREDGA
jgi:hypothetical protein